MQVGGILGHDRGRIRLHQQGCIGPACVDQKLRLRRASGQHIGGETLRQMQHRTEAVADRWVAAAVQAKGIPVFSEVEVAYRLCKAPIVAVTTWTAEPRAGATYDSSPVGALTWTGMPCELRAD